MSSRTGEEMELAFSDDESNVVHHHMLTDQHIMVNNTQPIGKSIKKTRYVNFGNNEERESVTDDDLFIACCKKMNYPEIGHLPRKQKDGCYKLNKYVYMKRPKKCFKEGAIRHVIPKKYFRRVYLKNLCRGKGKKMTASKKRKIVDVYCDRASKAKFVVCRGMIKEAHHNIPCGIAVNIDGVDSADIADMNIEDGGEAIGTAVDGVYIPENTGGFSRMLNEDFDESKTDEDINNMKNLNLHEINTNLQKIHSKNCYMLNVDSSIYKQLKNDKDIYGLKDYQLIPSQGSDELRLEASTGEMLRNDLIKKFNACKSHEEIGFHIKPHSRFGSWKCLDNIKKRTISSDTSPYKHRYSSMTDPEKELKLQFRVVLLIKFVN